MISELSLRVGFDGLLEFVALSFSNARRGDSEYHDFLLIELRRRTTAVPMLCHRLARASGGRYRGPSRLTYIGKALAC